MTERNTPARDDLLEQAGGLLFNLQRQIGFNEKKEVDCCGVTMTQCLTLLAFNGADHLLMGHLSERMHVAQSTMTRIVDPLVRDGLLTRTTDDRDRRAVAVRLTPEGKRTVYKLNNCYRDFWKKIFSRVPEKKQAGVVKSLEVLLQAMQQLEKTGTSRKGCCG